jgi:hypothetical protein
VGLVLHLELDEKTMRSLRNVIFFAITAGGLALMSGCADTSPTDPLDALSATAQLGKGNNGGGSDDGSNGSDKVKLTWLDPVNNSPTYAASCTPDADCVITGERGLVVAIPAGALSAPTQISVTLLNGNNVDFEFQPHGTVFNSPIGVSISQDETSGAGLKNKFYAIYWDSDPNIAVEVLDAYARKGQLTFFPDHFSGYALAM